MKARHGHALLYDAHSIRSEVPRLFDGRLPDLNLGTARGESCTPALRAALVEAVAKAPFSHVVDGRFVGGYITRTYGRPAEGVNAVQMELAQCRYMDEAPPFAYRPDLAASLRPTLATLLETLLAHRAD